MGGKWFISSFSLSLSPSLFVCLSLSLPWFRLCSAYRPWRRPRLTTDIQPLRRLFDPEADLAVPALPPILETEPFTSASAPKKRSRPLPTPPRLPNDDDDADDDDADDADEDEGGAAGTRPARPARAVKGRSASLVTTTPFGSATGGGHRLFGAAGSLGNLHVITTTTAGGIVTRNYFFAQRFARLLYCCVLCVCVLFCAVVVVIVVGYFLLCFLVCVCVCFIFRSLFLPGTTTRIFDIFLEPKANSEYLPSATSVCFHY